jgi:anaerobic selenocysteine-containing dehydrogenase
MGTPRLYTDFVFPTFTDVTEDYGHDLLTGTPRDQDEHKALQANGRAILRPAEFVQPAESPSEDYPLRLTTGRRVYHWHTRTKTGRVPELDSAAPDVWVELHPSDAQAGGIEDGARCIVESPRGRVIAPARLTGIRPGVVFVPFHYGYWDLEDDNDARAANELTITAWDPVSKQPLFKTASVRVRRAES